MRALERPVKLRSPRQRRRSGQELERAVGELADRANTPGLEVWRVQPIVEVAAPESYQAWRQARERRWRRERVSYTSRSWPARLQPGELAGVLLPQLHGGSYRGRPAEVAQPIFAHGDTPKPDRDYERPYEPLVLRVALTWAWLVLEEEPPANAVLLAPPLVDLITRWPAARVPVDLGLSWPLEVSQPHIRPQRSRF